MKTLTTVHVNDIVAIHANDLCAWSGKKQSDEGVQQVYGYGKIIFIDDKQIGLALLESVEGEEDSNFDYRIYIPLGCINSIELLQKGKEK